MGKFITLESSTYTQTIFYCSTGDIQLDLYVSHEVLHVTPIKNSVKRQTRNTY